MLSLSVLSKFYNQNKALPLPVMSIHKEVAIYGQCFLKYQPDTFIKPPLVILFPRGTLKFQLIAGGRGEWEEEAFPILTQKEEQILWICPLRV